VKLPLVDKSELLRAHRRLLEHFGPLDWWPADGPFEVMVGAILTQNTAWTRVVPAIENLKDAGVLDPHALHLTPEAEIAELVRPAGTFRVKARYLGGLAGWLVEGYDGDVAAALAGETAAKREELLRLKGIGRETADSILNYAGDHAIFVVDAYTRRIFSRHACVDPGKDYDAMREWFEERLPPEAEVLREMHAQIVNLGKHFCRPRAPRCAGCPLEYHLEETGMPRP